MRKHEKKCRVYVCFMDLEKADDWLIEKHYDVGSKLLNRINSMYINSLACVRVKGNGSRCYR